MVRRVTPAQLRSMVRQAEQQQQRAVREFNSAVNTYNREVKRVVDRYNQQVRTHNTQVRSNRAKLQSELRRLNARPSVTVRYTTSTREVRALEQRFTGFEEVVESGQWDDTHNLLDLAESEAAESVASLNELLSGSEQDAGELRSTTLTTELSDISTDLDARWGGALFALHPSNPDAARHFCTSAREMLTEILDVSAPDAAVKSANANYIRTPNGGVSRRAKIHYCLDRSGIAVDELVEFVDADINSVVALFDDFNRGTHGEAGRFPMPELLILKARVEKAVQFLHRLIRG